MERFGGDRVEINEAKEFRASVEMPNYGNPIRIQEPSPCPADRPAAAVAKPAPAAKVLANPFELGVIVKKKSDPSQIGPIVGIQGSGENTEYQVWIGNSRETLYADQILLADASPERCNVTIDELKILLTAQRPAVLPERSPCGFCSLSVPPGPEDDPCGTSANSCCRQRRCW